MKSRQIKMLIVLAFFVMAMLGSIENIRGAVIPSIQDYFGVNYTNMGKLMFISSLGYIVATFIGGSLSDILGQKKIMVIGIFLIAIGILGMTTTDYFYLFLLWSAIANYGYASLSIGVNTLVPVIFIRNQAIMMNLLHFFYGVGATLGPRYASFMIQVQWSWQKIYQFSLIVLIIFTIYFLFCKFPLIEEKKSEEKVPIRNILEDRKVILFAFILGFYVAAEIGIANWLTTYLQAVKNIDPLTSATYLSAFFGIFTFGRLIGGIIVERVGYLKSIFTFLILALTCLVLGTLGSVQLVVFIPIAGFFFSIIYPTIFAIIMKEFKEGISTIIGVIITISSSTNMLGNLLIGKINDIYGVDVGFAFIMIFLAIVLVLMYVLKRKINGQVEESTD